MIDILQMSGLYHENRSSEETFVALRVGRRSRLACDSLPIRCSLNRQATGTKVLVALNCRRDWLQPKFLLGAATLLEFPTPPVCIHK